MVLYFNVDYIETLQLHSRTKKISILIKNLCLCHPTHTFTSLGSSEGILTYWYLQTLPGFSHHFVTLPSAIAAMKFY